MISCGWADAAVLLMCINIVTAGQTVAGLSLA